MANEQGSGGTGTPSQPTYDPTSGELPGNAGYNWSGFNTISLAFRVNYSANGYNGANAENPPPSDARYYNGSPGTQSQNPNFTLGITVAGGETMSNPGYVFVGWATSSNTSTVSYDPGDRITHTWPWGNVGTYSITLYAVWTDQNVITYHPDSNSDEKAATYQVKQSGQAATIYGETFHRTGYTQVGWATEEGGAKVYDFGASYSSSTALSLYPVWQANTYTINFESNGGTGTMSAQTVTFDSTFTLSSCSFTREGYHFTSWNEDPDGKGLRWPIQEYTVSRAEDITLHAIWKGNEYTVSYDANSSRLSEELTGEIVSFETDYAQNIPELRTTLSPIQDLHGYSKPWAAGAGVNLCRVARGWASNQGVTYTENADGTVHAKGTATAESFSAGSITGSVANIDSRCMYTVPAGTYTISNIAGVRIWVQFRNADNTAQTETNVNIAVGGSKTVTFTEPAIIYIRSDIATGTVVDTDMQVMVTAGSTAATVYEPYSNICPITGYTGKVGRNLFDVDSAEYFTGLGGNANKWGHSFTTAGTYALKAYGDTSTGLVRYIVKYANDTWEANWINVNSNGSTKTIAEGDTLYVIDNAYTPTETEQGRDNAIALFNTWKVQVALSSTQPDQYYPYSNTGVSVYRAGKNLLPDVSNTSIGSITLTKNADGSYAMSGSTSTSIRVAIFNWWDISLDSASQNDRTKHLPNGTYYADTGVNGIRFQVCASNTAVVDDIQFLLSAKSGTFTIDDTYAYNWVRLRVDANVDPNVTLKPIICFNSEQDKSFEPCNGATYATGWTSTAGTVYGCTLDLVTGALTVDRFLIEKNWSDGTNAVDYGYCTRKRFSYSDADDKSKITDAICNLAIYIPTDTSAEWAKGGVFSIHVSSKLFYLSLPTSTDGATAIQLCCYLDTPITYQLTPEELETLKSQNHIWADSGLVTLRYKLDEETAGSMAPSTAVFGDPFYTRRNSLSRFGLTFKGWNTERDGSGETWLPSGVSMDTFKRTEDAIWNLPSNVILYAQWDPYIYPYGRVFFNGKYSSDFGVVVEQLPSYFYAERPFNHKAVNGKNGDALLDPNRYENVKKVYKLACYDPSRNFFESAVALSTWLHSAGSDYLRLEDSYEPSTYRMAIYEEANEIENIEGQAGKVEVTFSCMPQRFLISGDEEVTIASSGSTIHNPTVFNAKPLIFVEGTGNLTINGRTIEIYYNYNELTIDCEKDNAKDLAGIDMNGYIFCEEFPVLSPGFNTITYDDTITSVKIIPRWWIL